MVRISILAIFIGFDQCENKYVGSTPMRWVTGTVRWARSNSEEGKDNA